MQNDNICFIVVCSKKDMTWVSIINLSADRQMYTLVTNCKHIYLHYGHHGQ